MKILHVLSSNLYSGAENVVCTIIENSSNNYKSVYCSPTGPIKNVLVQKSIPHLLMEDFSLKNIYKSIKRFNPDLIVAHDFRASIKVSVLDLNKPIISHLHHNPPWIKKRGIRTLIYELFYSKFEYVFVVSNAIKTEFNLKNKDKIINISNPVDLKKIDNMLLFEKGQEVKEYDIIFVGRLHEAKNPKGLMNYFYKMVLHYPDIKIAVIGDGSEKCSMVKFSQEKNMSTNIDFLGHVENVYPYFSSSKLSVLTSKWEGFGLVVVESLYLGTPILSLRVGGVVDTLNEISYLLCNDIDEMVQKSLFLLENPEKANEIGAFAREHVSNEFDIEKYMDNLTEYYQRVHFQYQQRVTKR